MEKFKVGDKVNFLNDKGGGVITKIIDTRMAEVSIEEGFNIPCLMSELVLDYRSQPDYRQENVDKTQKEIQEKQIVETEMSDSARRTAIRRHGRNAEEEGLYLAFVPQDQQWILTGVLDIFIVNNTPADVLYSFNIKEKGKLSNVDYGSIEPFSKVLIETISRDDIEYWCNGLVQMVLCQDDIDFVYHPLHAPFSFRVNRFFKEGSYVESGVLGEKTVMICLSPLVALKGSEDDFVARLKEGKDITVVPQELKKQRLQ